MKEDTMKTRIEVAKGHKKADLVIKNGNIVNVFTKETVNSDIAIYHGVIAGIGKYDGIDEIDASGKYICPGFIDGHVHIESSLVTPLEFSKAILQHGTTSIIADPHEIANVCGKNGINYILNQTKDTLVNVYVMAPSCVPALSDKDLLELKESNERMIGLGEVMDYCSVLLGQPDILNKITAFENTVVDGHAPLLKGKDLNAYCSAGILTDHECSSIEEVIEKLRLGMYIQIREGSAAKNLEDILKGLLQRNINLHRCIFCTDDKQLSEIKEKGHINYNVKKAVEIGVDPFNAICMATLNTAQCYHLKNTGAVAPGYYADLLIVKDLHSFDIESVLVKGKSIEGTGKSESQRYVSPDKSVLNTVNIKKVALEDLRIRLKGNRAHVIQLIPGQILTKKTTADVKAVNGTFIPDGKYAKLVVVERHKALGNIGLGIVEGFEIKNGAIGSTVAHDAHNIVVAGDNDRDILLAIEELKRAGGGFTVVRDGRVINTLELPVAGLMSGLDAGEVEKQLKAISRDVMTVCGNEKIDPFITLSFLSLTVIPEIRITDKGIFDVENNGFIDVNQ